MYLKERSPEVIRRKTLFFIVIELYVKSFKEGWNLEYGPSLLIKNSVDCFVLESNFGSWLKLFGHALLILKPLRVWSQDFPEKRNEMELTSKSGKPKGYKDLKCTEMVSNRLSP